MIEIIKKPHRPKYSFVIPISRQWRIDKIFDGLENILFPDSTKTELLIYFDGKKIYQQYVRARLKYFNNFDKYNGIKVFFSGTEPLKDDAPVIARRQRVIEIWETIKPMLSRTSLITFGMEDDMMIPADAFVKLNCHLQFNHDIGYATGVAVGRWKKPILCVWHIIYNEKNEAIQVESCPKGKGIEYIEGGGLYCFAVLTKLIKAHTFIDQAPCLSVDVSFVESIIKLGYKAVVDWNILCGHILENGRVLKPNDPEVIQTKWIKNNNEWLQLP